MSNITIKEEDIVAKEFRFGVHIPSRDPESPDWHMIKEQVHLKDGSVVPRIRYLKDYKRPMWITKPAFRNHQDKKEYEDLDKLLVKSVTQSNLRTEVAKSIGKAWSREGMRELCASPYVYGTDISSTTIIKKTMYMNKWPNTATPYSVCTFDTETDMIHGHGEVIMASAAFKNEVFISVTKASIQGYSDQTKRFYDALDKYLGDIVSEHDLKVTFHIAEDQIDVLRNVFKQIHAWKPDFLAIWNIDFDLGKVFEACDKAGISPNEIFCDPNIPPHMQLCKYKRGRTKMITASGVVKPLPAHSQWHTLFCTASFYAIDAMSVYKLLRGMEGEEPSYSLDAILTKKIKRGKLKFEAADKYQKGAWHMFMQKNYIFEYAIYNVFDSFSMLLLDKETKDLSTTLPQFADTTDFCDFNSQPKKIRDALFWFCLTEHRKVLGTVGPKREDPVPTPQFTFNEDGEEVGEDDEEGGEEGSQDVLSRSGWVLTLPAHMSVLGQPLIKEDPRMLTSIRGFVYDSDVVSSYPNCTLVANVSKATTRKEIIRIGNIDEQVFRMQNLNIIFGEVNAMDYSTTMFGMPKPKDLLQQFLADVG